MRTKFMTNPLKARLAGIACMIGGLTFSFYFIALHSLLNAFSPPIKADAIPAVKMIISCVASVCLAGGSIGLLAVRAAGTGRVKAMGVAGAVITLLGLVSYITGSLYIYISPNRAFKQLFTPGGSFLLTSGMLLLGIAVLKARKLRGWRAAAPLLVSLYFPLQFPLQALLFLGNGRGPNPILLGAWGVFWLLLGYAIWSIARETTATRFELEEPATI
jgi:hypothetical protein